MDLLGTVIHGSVSKFFEKREHAEHSRSVLIAPLGFATKLLLLLTEGVEAADGERRLRRKCAEVLRTGLEGDQIRRLIPPPPTGVSVLEQALALLDNFLTFLVVQLLA
jgi:hypothetical protein